jgi:DNA-3-methyladenine glycosylase
MKKLPLSFYRRDHVLEIAQELLGKILVTNFENQRTSGRIVELEAYHGVGDRASHAWNGRRTARTEIMYAQGGVAYIYLCYGIHHLFNVVTGAKDNPHAILIRAVEPVAGIDIMESRMKRKLDPTLTRGPGNVSRALGINTSQTGLSLTSNEIYIADDGFVYPEKHIASSPRIGVDYAGTDALLSYRYYIKGNRFVSGKPR